MAPKITIEPFAGTVSIRAGGAVLAESMDALVLREERYPPVYYLPRKDAGIEFLDRSGMQTVCPYKGEAMHFHLVVKSGTIENAAWSYEDPIAGAEAIAGHIAYYADKVTVSVI